MLTVGSFDHAGFAQRLKSLQGELSERAFAMKVGISATSLNNYLNGQTPGVDKVVLIASACGVSVSWLITGRDEPEARVEETVSDTVSIPYLDVRAAAGAGATGNSEAAIGSVSFPRAFLRSLGVNPANLRVLTARGDSMLPTISDGDPLVVDVSASRIGGAAIYVLVRDGEVIVKRAERRLNGSILVTSDNDRYPPEEINDASGIALNVAGRVIWHGRLV